MPDPRVSKLAKVLVQYSVEVQKGQQVAIRTSPIADELTLAVYEEVVKKGGHPLVVNEVPGIEETFFRTPQMSNWIMFHPYRSWCWIPSTPASRSGASTTPANSAASARNEYPATARRSLHS